MTTFARLVELSVKRVVLSLLLRLCSSVAQGQDKCKMNSLLFMCMTGREMLHEKNKEIDGMNKEFQRQIQVLVEDHKKEVDVSICVELEVWNGLLSFLKKNDAILEFFKHPHLDAVVNFSYDIFKNCSFNF